MPKTYLAYNGPMPTAAATPKVTTGTAIKTMMQLRANAADVIQVLAWGISFDGSALGTPGIVELLETGTIGATVTAYVAADLMPQDDPNAPASLVQIGSTANSGYTSTVEGSIVATRVFDTQLVDPAMGYSQVFSEGDRPEIKINSYLRIRVTFGSAVNALCWIRWRE